MAIVTTSGNISTLLNLNNNTLQPAADRLQEHLYNFVDSLYELSEALVYETYREVTLTPNLLNAVIWYPETAEITVKGSGFLGSSGKVSQILYNGYLYNWDITGNSSWSLNKGIHPGTISSINLWNESNSERFTLKGAFTFSENGISGTLNSSSIQYNDLEYEQTGSIKLSTEPSGKLSSILYKDAHGSITFTGSFAVNQASITNTLGELFDQAGLFSGNDTFNVSDNSRAWFGFAGNDIMYGGYLDDELHGGSGNDLLDGGAGSDFMYGGTGNDTYIVDDIDDVVTEDINEGTDTVRSSINHDLANNVEHLILTGDDNTNGTGNEQKNSIIGNLGNNTIDGGADVDKLAGGAGNDTYIVDLIVKGSGKTTSLVLEDSITEKADEGDDSLKLRISAEAIDALKDATKTTTVTLAANLEKLDASATGNIALNLIGHKNTKSLTGNAGNNILDAKGGAATLSGLAGDDTYVVYSGDDLARITEAEDQGNDTLQITFKGAANGQAPTRIDLSTVANIENINVTGSGLFTLMGNDEENRLSGNNSGTVLAGGAGNDTYVLNHKNDTILEESSNGIDTIETAKLNIKLDDYTNVENVTMTGKAALNATGNDQANTLIGNDGNNILDGGRNAPTSSDTLRGGKGNDTYIVNNAGDVVEELANEGIDTIKASVDYNLSKDLNINVENLILTGESAINGTGNDLNNIITGNNSDNTLDGGAGVDKLVGGDGDDTYIVDLITKGKGAKATIALEDSITEKAKQGGDTLELRMADKQLGSFTGKAAITLAANLENLDASGVTGSINISITGNSADNIIWGNNGNNVITGGAGNDIIYAGNGAENTLIGGAGADTLYGGTGKDTFAFTSLKDLGLDDKQDVIHDFGSTQDMLDFKALKGWTLVEGGFSGTKQLRYEIDGDDVKIYGNSGGTFDADFSIKLVGASGVFSADNFALI